ncbi:MAG: putative O-glycosylation ligase, exosortase A system-associated [Burkholderiaceae bacterium]|nr:putative O-glycosylation ligase, exosortase A system-associated [Burkholderiaceae bacterium]
MRDIVLTLVFAGILPFAFKHTWIGVLLWTWFSVMNPHRLTYGFANGLPFAFMAAIAVLASTLWNRRELRFPKDAISVFTVLFTVWICITTAAGFMPEQSMRDLDRALKVLVMVVISMTALRERRHIEWFIWVNVLSIGYYGLKGGLFTIASGGGARVWGPTGSFLEGNNEIGLAFIMMIPFANYLRVISPHRWVRRGLMLIMLLSAAGALGTQSRGAFLAIVAMGLVLWLRSSRKAVGALGIGTAAVLLLMFMPESWEQRMNTIGTYQSDASAQGRLNAWTTAINIANDRITGGGFYIEHPSVFSIYAPNPEVIFTAHSIYFQALGEQGWTGLFLFMSIGAAAFWSAGRLRKAGLEREEMRWLHELGGMAQVSMVGFAVGGAFLSLTYLDLSFNVAVIVVCAKCWMLEERWRTDTVGALGARAPRPAGDPKLHAWRLWRPA